MADKTKPPQHAVLFSGGGANAAYEVGVVKALAYEPSQHVASSPIEPDIYTGISIGSLNAVVMASKADRGAKVASDYLERLWRERIAGPSGVHGNGIFRFRLNPFQYLDPRTWLTPDPEPFGNFMTDALLLARETFRRTAQFISSEESFEEIALRVTDLSSGIDFQPLSRLVREAVEIEKIPTAPARLRVTAANWESGHPEVFGNEDLKGENGYQAIVAAAAIPGVVPSQRIRDTLFVAGAVLSDTPLVPAIRAAGESDDGGERELVIHAIYFDPETARVPSSGTPSTLVSSIRLYTIAFSRSVNGDLERARSVNERLAIRDTLAPDAKDHEAARVVLEDMASDLEGKIKLTVHRYRPSRASSELFGLLQFDRERIEQQIEAGYHDARHHDCKKAGCIHPD